MMDQYRVTLFKKELRKIIGAPWTRFYFSKGKCHLCIEGYSFGQNNLKIAIDRLRQGKIDHKVERDIFGMEQDKPEHERRIWSVSIPIDQEALPERKRNNRH